MRRILLLAIFLFLLEEKFISSERLNGRIKDLGKASDDFDVTKTNWEKKGRITSNRNELRGRHRKAKRALEDLKKFYVVFPNEKTMLEMGEKSKPGAVAYVKDGDKFFGKSSKGWSQFMMGPLVTEKQQNDVPPRLFSTVETMNISKDNFWYPKLSVEKKHVNTGRPFLRLVALNEPYTGAMCGIKKINFECQRQAIEAKLDGIFRAFLASKNLKLAEILNPIASLNFTIANIKGMPIFESYDKLRTHIGEWPVVNNIATPIFSFNEKNVIYDEHWPINLVWHGQWNISDSGNINCDEWTSDSNTTYGMVSDYLYRGLFDSRKQSCNEKRIVICLEIDAKSISPSKLSEESYTNILKNYQAKYERNGESSSSDSQYDDTEPQENNDSENW